MALGYLGEGGGRGEGGNEGGERGVWQERGGGSCKNSLPRGRKSFRSDVQSLFIKW